jgi:hypothetical protein
MLQLRSARSRCYELSISTATPAPTTTIPCFEFAYVPELASRHPSGGMHRVKSSASDLKSCGVGHQRYCEHRKMIDSILG